MMKQLGAIFLSVVILFMSCSQEQLPKEMINDNSGYNKLTDYIYSHFPEIKDNIEVLEFSYSSRVISASSDEMQSTIEIDFVNGTNKDRIVNYSLKNDGTLKNANVDISVGEMFNEKKSNNYETYKPFLFSSKEIDLDILRKVVNESMEKFKKDANVENPICGDLTISKQSGTPEISIKIQEKKLTNAISRNYKWSMDGTEL